MYVYDGARLMTLVISTECANPSTLVEGGLVLSGLFGVTIKPAPQQAWDGSKSGAG